MVRCPNCYRELKQIKGKVKIAVQLGDDEIKTKMSSTQLNKTEKEEQDKQN